MRLQLRSLQALYPGARAGAPPALWPLDVALAHGEELVAAKELVAETYRVRVEDDYVVIEI